MNIIFDDPVEVLVSAGLVIVDHNRCEIEDVWLDGVAIWRTADKKLRDEIWGKFDALMDDKYIFNPYRDER